MFGLLQLLEQSSFQCIYCTYFHVSNPPAYVIIPLFYVMSTKANRAKATGGSKAETPDQGDSTKEQTAAKGSKSVEQRRASKKRAPGALISGALLVGSICLCVIIAMTAQIVLKKKYPKSSPLDAIMDMVGMGGKAPVVKVEPEAVEMNSVVDVVPQTVEDEILNTDSAPKGANKKGTARAVSLQVSALTSEGCSFVSLVSFDA